MDITRLILDDHQEQRRLFAIIDELTQADVDALSAVWARLRALLDTHAEAEERFFYPELLRSAAAPPTAAAQLTKPAMPSEITTRYATRRRRLTGTRSDRVTGLRPSRR